MFFYIKPSETYDIIFIGKAENAKKPSLEENFSRKQPIWYFQPKKTISPTPRNPRLLFLPKNGINIPLFIREVNDDK